uniref:Uncharacterized protein n=1 Tax=Aegilops tauschii subsp. strangulata TaxID=200361 RepID=A0A453ASH4_AEGTS
KMGSLLLRNIYYRIFCPDVHNYLGNLSYNMVEIISTKTNLLDGCSQRVIGAVNGFLVFSIIASFTVLVVVASGNIQWSSLLETNFAAAPQSIPIIALSFVYQNVVPVLCTNLEGDLSKVRKAIVLGTAIPLALFLVWDAVILGTIPGFAESGTITDPLQQLRSSNGTVGAHHTSDLFWDSQTSSQTCSNYQVDRTNL